MLGIRSSIALRSVASTVAREIPSASLAKPPATQFGILRRFYADLPPHIKINMPALSPTMTSGHIGKWNKKVGDAVNAGDVLVEIETDKAAMDFECQEEGYVAKIFIPSGTKDVPINKPIAILAENKADIPKFENYSPDSATAEAPKKEEKKQTPPPPAAAAPSAPSAAAPAPSAAAPAPVASNDARLFISPAAKKLALEKGVNVTQIRGSGPNGRIVLADVEKALSSAPSKAASTPAPSTPSAASPAPSKAAKKEEAAAFVDIPLSNIRKVIASRLTESKQTIPHYYLTIEVNVDKLLELRAQFNAKGEHKLSVNDFIIKAAGKALLKVPEVNSSWQNEYIRQYNSADISVAVATERGLITPIVFAAEQKGIAEISKTVKELSAKAKEGKLAPHEYQGGTFSISNLGMFGIKHFTAIINPPQSCILAVGSSFKAVIPDQASEKGFRSANLLTVTLSCDHRVVDGAVGATWLQAFKGFVEEPVTMLL